MQPQDQSTFDLLWSKPQPEPGPAAPDRIPKPVAPKPVSDAIPAELRELARWVVWRYAWTEAKGKGKARGKWTKIPFDATTGRKASTTDPETWSTFIQAIEALHGQGGFDGIGFVLVEADDIVGVDIDGCIKPDGTLEDFARSIVETLPGYWERTPSGRGLRGWFRGKLPPGGRKKTLAPGMAVEVYEWGRYLTATGDRWPGSLETIEPRAAELVEVHARLFGSKTEAPVVSTSGSRLESSPTDDELIAKARAARNGPAFGALLDGDLSAHQGDASAADLALCSHLSFWFGDDPVAIDRVFRRSGLMRPKWDEKRGAQTYGERTVAKALEGHSEGEIAKTVASGLTASMAEPRTRRPAARGSTRASAKGAGKSSGEAGDDPMPETQDQTLLKLADAADLFRSDDGGLFATFPVCDHRETHRIRDAAFKLWLTLGFYLVRNQPPSSEAMQKALGVLESKARFDGPQLVVFTRIASVLSKGRTTLYLDLGDDRWRAIRIDVEGWAVVESGAVPVRFLRAKGVKALPVPVKGGKLADLRRFVNLPDDDQWMLYIAWVASALYPDGPKVILSIGGEQGSAKTTTVRIARDLTDPNCTPLRSAPRNEEDLMIAAVNSWVLAYDNLGLLSAWLADALCRITSGGGFTTRAKYTNAEEAHFNARRPILLNGIEDISTRGDFLDRCLLLKLPAIPDHQRREEGPFWREFEAARPAILGALLDGISGALRLHPTVILDGFPRMADFARWAEAFHRATGREAGAFLDTYERSRKDATELALEASPLAEAVRSLVVAERHWCGTSSELLERLRKVAGEAATKEKSWPKAPNALSGKLRRLAPALRRQEIDVSLDSRIGTRRVVELSAAMPRCHDDPLAPSTVDDAASPPGSPRRIPCDQDEFKMVLPFARDDDDEKRPLSAPGERVVGEL